MKQLLASSALVLYVTVFSDESFAHTSHLTHSHENVWHFSGNILAIGLILIVIVPLIVAFARQKE